MDSVFSFEEPIVTFGSDVYSSSSLLEYGLQGMREGHCAEKIVSLASAHNQLIPSQVPLMAIIDAFTQSYAKYQSALQMLQETSKHFAEANAELQANLSLLEKQLPSLIEDTDLNSLTVPQCLRSLLGQRESSLSQPSPKNSHECEALPQLQPLSEDHHTLPTLHFTCFGHFEVRRLDQPLTLCQSRRGQAILRYLMAQPGYRAVADRLIEVFCPQDELDSARRKLQVAVSALRCSLNGDYVSDPRGGYILLKDCIYQLNPAVTFISDVDEFLESV